MGVGPDGTLLPETHSAQDWIGIGGQAGFKGGAHEESLSFVNGDQVCLGMFHRDVAVSGGL